MAVSLESETLPLDGLDAHDQRVSAVEILGIKSKSLELLDQEGGVVVFRVRANQPVGAARLRVTATT